MNSNGVCCVIKYYGPDYSMVLRRFIAFMFDTLLLFFFLWLGSSFILGGTLGGSIGAVFYGISLFLLFLAINIYFWNKGTTPGKNIFGMYVCDTCGKQLALSAMFLRETIGKIISLMIFMLGFAWVLVDNRMQGWHDKLVGSVVLLNNNRQFSWKIDFTKLRKGQ